LVKIHLLFRIMILIEWSVNISVFVNHVVIVFWGPNEGDRKSTYIPCLFSEYMLTLRVEYQSIVNDINKRQRKLMGQSRMDDPETLEKLCPRRICSSCSL
jgi:hypothetical protein